MRERHQELIRWLGRSGLVFAAFALLYLAAVVVSPLNLLRPFAFLAMLLSGVWMCVSLLRRLRGQLIWSLRNRLLVTYTFIAAVPILLVAALLYEGGRALVSQLAVYMVTSQLDRRIDTLQSFADSVVRTDPATRPFLMEKSLDLFYADRFPGIEILLRERDEETRYPEGATNETLPAPLPGWKKTSGVLVRDGKFYLWAYEKTLAGDVTIMAPLTTDFLAQLVPRLGRVEVAEEHLSDRAGVAREVRALPVAAPLPPSESRFGRSRWQRADRERSSGGTSAGRSEVRRAVLSHGRYLWRGGSWSCRRPCRRGHSAGKSHRSSGRGQGSSAGSWAARSRRGASRH